MFGGKENCYISFTAITITVTRHMQEVKPKGGGEDCFPGYGGKLKSAFRFRRMSKASAGNFIRLSVMARVKTLPL